MKVNKKPWLVIAIAGLILAAAIFFLIAIIGAGADRQAEPLHSSTAIAPSLSVSAIEEPEPAPYLAWLTYPGTAIDGPVVQGEDNDYYERRNENGETDVWGCYYFDYECSTSPVSRNLIIYGHSLADSTTADRFSQLKLLNDPSFAEEYRLIEVTIDGTTHQYEVFSAGYASALTDNIAIEAAPDDATLQDIIDLALARSLIDFGTEVTTADKLLTLVTCTSDEDTRYVVTARLV